MKIGFIGLGIMGRPMALNLLRAGHELTVWARRAESMQPLLEAGASGADSPAGVAGAVDLAISIVADAPDVEQVMLGEDGVASAGRAGLVAVDMSTIRPAAARDIGARLREQGVDFLDAPVSGGEVGAIAGSLSIMVGGSVAAFVTARPAFECMGRNIVHVGDSGAGQVAKAANQIVTGAGVLTVAEALNFAARSGVDPAKVREALLGGFAYSKILENHGQRMLDRNFKPGFRAELMRKDIRLALGAVRDNGVFAPSTALAAQMMEAVVNSGRGGQDCASLGALVAELSGLKD